jgi:hypothetical protein
VSRPRLVATDLDGTLVRRDHSISPRSVATLARVAEGGCHVVLVTGRPLRWMAKVLAELGTDPLTVCANGAVVYDPARDEVVHSRPLEPPVLAEAYERVRAAVPDVRIAVERDGGRALRHEPRYVVGGWEVDSDAVAPAPVAELLAEPAAKLLARSAATWVTPAGPGDADRLAERVRQALDGVAEATHSSSSGMVEISAPGVTKAAGLGWVADRLGVAAADVVAFGDMPNDLPMLGWAGRGIAMANAHPAVLEVADEVTVSNDEDGVAAWLERWLRPER